MRNNRIAVQLLQDKTLARILLSSNPLHSLSSIEHEEWLSLTEDLKGEAWKQFALDYRNGKHRHWVHYSKDEVELEELRVVYEHLEKFSNYRQIMTVGCESPFSDYLSNNISVEDFYDLMRPLRGMDAAREIQRLYKEGVISSDLGGTKLHAYMENLGLPFIPTVNHLNEARRGEIPAPRYNMSKSRERELQIERRVNTNRNSLIQ